MFTLMVLVLLSTGDIWQGTHPETFPTKEACEAQFAQDEPMFLKPGTFTSKATDEPLDVIGIEHACEADGRPA